MPRALLSVSDKSGLVDLASGLRSRGFELVSTGGTARALAEAGLPVTNVSDVTKFPEMMDGRVKTLHPLVHGGILARRAHAEDLEAARAHGIGLIDLVVVNLYPFVKTAAKADVAFDDLIEQIDIGGPSMVRAAAKNFRDVLVVVDPADYPQVLAALDAPGGASAAFRFDLARKAFGHTAAYDAAIAGTLGTIESKDDDFVRPAPGTAGAAAALRPRPAESARSPLRREPASEGRVVRQRRRRLRRRADPAGQGAVLHEPARSRFRRAHRPRVQ